MQTNPLVSVVIPNYNYARYLRQAIDGVLGQTYTPIEIIVVDDGSRDESEKILRDYGERILWFRQKNQGVSAARNRGVSESRGDLIAFLDSDDVWKAEKVERQVRKFLAEPDLGLVHCGVEEFNDEGKVLRILSDGKEGWVAHDLLLFKCSVVLGGGSGLMVPKAVFDQVGGFDQRLSTSADWEFFYRVADRYRVGFVPEILVRYRFHDTNMHANVALMEHDTKIGYEKAFSRKTPELRKIRRQCYGNFHLTLAGSYYQSGQKAKFLLHSLRTVWYSPRNAGYLLSAPFRWLERWNRRST